MGDVLDPEPRGVEGRERGSVLLGGRAEAGDVDLDVHLGVASDGDDVRGPVPSGRGGGSSRGCRDARRTAATSVAEGSAVALSSWTEGGDLRDEHVVGAVGDVVERHAAAEAEGGGVGALRGPRPARQDEAAVARPRALGRRREEAGSSCVAQRFASPAYVSGLDANAGRGGGGGERARARGAEARGTTARTRSRTERDRGGRTARGGRRDPRRASPRSAREGASAGRERAGVDIGTREARSRERRGAEGARARARGEMAFEGARRGIITASRVVSHAYDSRGESTTNAFVHRTGARAATPRAMPSALASFAAGVFVATLVLTHDASRGDDLLLARGFLAPVGSNVSDVARARAEASFADARPSSARRAKARIPPRPTRRHRPRSTIARGPAGPPGARRPRVHGVVRRPSDGATASAVASSSFASSSFASCAAPAHPADPAPPRGSPRTSPPRGVRGGDGVDQARPGALGARRAPRLGRADALRPPRRLRGGLRGLAIPRGDPEGNAPRLRRRRSLRARRLRRLRRGRQAPQAREVPRAHPRVQGSNPGEGREGPRAPPRPRAAFFFKRADSSTRWRPGTPP